MVLTKFLLDVQFVSVLKHDIMYWGPMVYDSSTLEVSGSVVNLETF
jgi:hypothetical protein